MLDDPREQLKQAYTLIKAGQKPQAFAMLNSLVEQQPTNAEGWWLVANAAPTPKVAIDACQRVLALKPDYAPAIKMLADQNLLEALNLIEQKKKPEARALIQSVLDKQPDNIRAQWAMANAAHSQVDAVMALQKILVIEPDHTAARQMLMELQQQSAKGIAEKRKLKDARPPQRKTRWWMVFALLGIIGLTIGGGYFAINLTGNTFGLPVGQLFSAKYSLGRLGDKPLSKAGMIIAGATHDYQFYGRINTHVLLLVMFPVLKSDPTKAIKIIGPNNHPLDVSQSSTLSMPGAYDITLPTTGSFTIRITGTKDIAQGPYQLQLVAVPDMQDLHGFGDVTQP